MALGEQQSRATAMHGMRKSPFSALFLLLLAACAAQRRSTSDAPPPQEVAAVPRCTLVVFSVANYAFPSRDERNNQGFVFEVSGDCSIPTSTQAWDTFLQSSPVAGVFRSARESRLVISDLLGRHPSTSLKYVEASHDCSGWTGFERPSGPLDQFRWPDREEAEMGDPNSGFLGDYVVLLWPEPLATRGFAIALSRIPGNGLVYTLPKDRATTFVTRWTALEPGHTLFVKECDSGEWEKYSGKN